MTFYDNRVIGVTICKNAAWAVFPNKFSFLIGESSGMASCNYQTKLTKSPVLINRIRIYASIPAKVGDVTK